jgi:copper/silver efflux system protein
MKENKEKFMILKKVFKTFVLAVASADVMRCIAAPLIGGIFTSFILELVVYTAIYEVWKWNTEIKRQQSVA